jgi:hypothetical protein
MPFKMDCPHCQKTLNVGEKAIGKTIPCPGCNQPVTIQQEQESQGWLGLLEEVTSSLPDKKQLLQENNDANPSCQQFIVSICDISTPYDVIGPVYFQVSNKGIFSSDLSNLVKQYQSRLEEMKKSGLMSKERADWGFLYGEWSVGQSDFEKAFYIAVEELKKRAEILGADAIIGLRQDIDLDTNGFQFFYLQMYGTAVRRK